MVKKGQVCMGEKAAFLYVVQFHVLTERLSFKELFQSRDSSSISTIFRLQRDNKNVRCYNELQAEIVVQFYSL